MQKTIFPYHLILILLIPVSLFGQGSDINKLLGEAKSKIFSEPVQALSLADSARTMAKLQKALPLQAEAEKTLALLHAEAGNYVESISAALSALSIFQGLKDIKEECRMYVYLGIIYKYQVQYEQSLEYYGKAEVIATQQQYDTLKASILGNIGNVYIQKKEFDKALEYHQKALEAFKAINSPTGISNSLHNLGMIYREQGLFEKALDYYRQSLDSDSDSDNLRNIALTHIEFMELYLELGNFQEALANGEEALELAEKVQSLRLKSQVLEYLPLIYAAQGNYSAARDRLKEFQQISDSLQRVTVAEQVAEMQTRFDTQEKEKELRLQEYQLEAQRLSIRQQRLFIAILICVLLLSALMAYLLFNRYRIKQKTRRLQLKMEADNIRQLDQMKSRFFANISHEFRTPLNLILAPLQNRTKSPDAQDLDMMRRNAGRLLRLVNQLLDLARIEVGLMPLDKKNLEVSRFLAEIAQAFVPMAEAKKVDYQIDIPERDFILQTDADKLEKIAYNLLSNAIKFTDTGGRVGVHLAKDAEGKIRFSVSDTGIGINKDLKSRIFERFYQADSSTTRQHEGSGIGLALTKELVDLLGAQIHVDSQEGKGSTFTVLLPSEIEEIDLVSINELPEKETGKGQAIYTDLLPFQSEMEVPSTFSNDEKPILLFVEDNEELRHYVKKQLRDLYNVITAADGSHGLEIAQKQIPDLVISDIMMPVLDGISMTRQLRANDLTSHIPIILLTAREDDETKISGFETGAEQFLAKPFQIEELSARIKSLLAQRERLHQKFGREVKLAPKDITLHNRDAQLLENLINVVEDNLENESFSVEVLQKEIGMSRMQLHRKLKGLVNQSTGEFIRTIKLKRAAQLLMQPGIQVTEVAYQSGFNHLSYFAKCFKETYGLSPSQYAEKHANMNGGGI